jgi:hypothetical protein
MAVVSFSKSTVMRLNLIVKAALLAVLSLPVLFTACVKDSCKKMYTYKYFVPVYKTKDEVRANIRSNSPKEIKNTGKLYTYGNYIFLSEIDKGIHVINNSNPASPQKVAFIDIPGTLDLAVEGNTLYADLYTDLVTIDITDPSHVALKKVTENVFPYRYWGGGFVSNSSSNIIVDWIERDTTVTWSCENEPSIFMDNTVFLSSSSGGGTSGNAQSPVGAGGSMARFTIMNDRLYTVTTTDLDVFDISNSNNPVRGNHVSVGMNIETIYPFKDNLFIGSMTGMFIYNVGNPDNPVRTGQFNHVRTCDPVIADNDYAYVTLRSGTPCTGFANELDILQLNNLTNPALIKVYQLTNPHGLSKDGDYLFICDDGLKLYNAADVNNLQLLKHISGPETFDVIARNNIAFVVAKDGLYQYDYSDVSNVRLVSKLSVANQ